MQLTVRSSLPGGTYHGRAKVLVYQCLRPVNSDDSRNSSATKRMRKVFILLQHGHNNCVQTNLKWKCVGFQVFVIAVVGGRRGCLGRKEGGLLLFGRRGACCCLGGGGVVWEGRRGACCCLGGGGVVWGGRRGACCCLGGGGLAVVWEEGGLFGEEGGGLAVVWEGGCLGRKEGGSSFLPPPPPPPSVYCFCSLVFCFFLFFFLFLLSQGVVFFNAERWGGGGGEYGGLFAQTTQEVLCSHAQTPITITELPFSSAKSNLSEQNPPPPPLCHRQEWV